MTALLPLEDETFPWIVNGSRFDLHHSVSVDEMIGEGAYGTVVSARVGKRKVAIKKVNHRKQKTSGWRRTVRELVLLRILGNHDNIVQLLSVSTAPGFSLEEIYYVFELFETDLTSVIRSPQDLSVDHARFFVFQLLRGLKYIHSHDVLHRDIKSRNLLVNSNCDLKICDFGLARLDDGKKWDGRKVLTDYVATRWYRAPEIILRCPCYGKPVDIWGVGCVLGELLTRKPLFPGKDTKDQMRRVMDRLGKPPQSLMQTVDDVHAVKFVQQHKLPDSLDPAWRARLKRQIFPDQQFAGRGGDDHPGGNDEDAEDVDAVSQGLGDLKLRPEEDSSGDVSGTGFRGSPWEELVPDSMADPYAIDLLSGLLEMDPDKRPSAHVRTTGGCTANTTTLTNRAHLYIYSCRWHVFAPRGCADTLPSLFVRPRLPRLLRFIFATRAGLQTFALLHADPAGRPPPPILPWPGRREQRADGSEAGQQRVWV